MGTLYWGSLTESDGSGNLTSEYVFVGGKRVARRDVASGAVYYYLSDHLGSSNVVADALGNIQNESDFYPFGVVVQGGVNYSVAGLGVSYVPSTGDIYGTATVGTPGTGAYAAIGLTNNPDQMGTGVSASAFAVVGGTVSVSPDGDVTTGVGVGTPGAGAAYGVTSQIGHVAPATVSVKITAIPAESAVPIGDGLYTQEDWPH